MVKYKVVGLKISVVQKELNVVLQLLLTLISLCSSKSSVLPLVVIPPGALDYSGFESRGKISKVI